MGIYRIKSNLPYLNRIDHIIQMQKEIIDKLKNRRDPRGLNTSLNSLRFWQQRKKWLLEQDSKRTWVEVKRMKEGLNGI
jgi:hypothetical protein